MATGVCVPSIEKKYERPWSPIIYPYRVDQNDPGRHVFLAMTVSTDTPTAAMLFVTNSISDKQFNFHISSHLRKVYIGFPALRSIRVSVQDAKDIYSLFKTPHPQFGHLYVLPNALRVLN